MRRSILQIVIIYIFFFITFSSFAKEHKIQLLRDAEIESLLKEYTAPLLKVAKISPTQVKIHIVIDPRINAFVSPENNLFLHTGLILTADTPNALIGVIAHEIGHLSAGHLQYRSQNINSLKKSHIVNTLLSVGAIVAGQPDAALGILAGGQHIIQQKILRYSRHQETEADLKAIDFLNKSQQSMEGLRQILQRLNINEVSRDRKVDPYQQSHPLSQNRISILNANIEKSLIPFISDTNKLKKRHHMVQTKINAFLNNPQITLQRFHNNHSDAGILSKSIAYYKQGHKNKSIELVNKLIKLDPNNPYFHEFKGQILFEAGEVDKSIIHYQNSVTLAPMQSLLLYNLAKAKIAQENSKTTQEAISILKKALTLDPKNASFYYQLAIAYSQTHDIGNAELATAEYFYIYNNIQRAKNHAYRALKLFKKYSIQWIRAKDITNQKKDK